MNAGTARTGDGQEWRKAGGVLGGLSPEGRSAFLLSSLSSRVIFQLTYPVAMRAWTGWVMGAVFSNLNDSMMPGPIMHLREPSLSSIHHTARYC